MAQTRFRGTPRIPATPAGGPELRGTQGSNGAPAPREACRPPPAERRTSGGAAADADPARSSRALRGVRRDGAELQDRVSLGDRGRINGRADVLLDPLRCAPGGLVRASLVFTDRH